MSVINSAIEQVLQQRKQGFSFPIITESGSTQTGATTGTGQLQGNIQWNVMGTVRYSALIDSQDAPFPSGASYRAASLALQVSRATAQWLGRAYYAGDINLTATGSQYTAASGTFPVTRKRPQGATTPIPLLLFLLFTTASSVTPPVFTIDYVNQDGVSKTTPQFTAPAAATVIGSGYYPTLAAGDTAVQKVTAVNVVTASTTGAVRVFLMEPCISATAVSAGLLASNDAVSRIQPNSMNPAAPTSGNITSYLGAMGTATSTTTITGNVQGYKDTADT